MPIYIAYDYDNKVENIITAKSRELAEVYWQGKGVYACNVEEYSEKNLMDHITGVIPILNTQLKEASFDNFTCKKVRIVSKL